MSVANSFIFLCSRLLIYYYTYNKLKDDPYHCFLWLLHILCIYCYRGFSLLIHIVDNSCLHTFQFHLLIHSIFPSCTMAYILLKSLLTPMTLFPFVLHSRYFLKEYTTLCKSSAISSCGIFADCTILLYLDNDRKELCFCITYP